MDSNHFSQVGSIDGQKLGWNCGEQLRVSSDKNWENSAHWKFSNFSAKFRGIEEENCTEKEGSVSWKTGWRRSLALDLFGLGILLVSCEEKWGGSIWSKVNISVRGLLKVSGGGSAGRNACSSSSREPQLSHDPLVGGDPGPRALGPSGPPGSPRVLSEIGANYWLTDCLLFTDNFLSSQPW